MNPSIFFISADESELNALLRGESLATAIPWHGEKTLSRPPKGSIGVLAKKPNPSADFFQPLVLIAHEEAFQRLFGRISQVRSELSPLSAWCHVLTPSRFAVLDELTREPSLGGYEAAWTGLVVAHALLLSELPISKLKIAACLATETFAIARMKALWEPAPIPSIIERYNAVQQALRVRESRDARVRLALQPIWACLAAVSSGDFGSLEHPLRPVANAVRELHESRLRRNSDEVSRFALSLSNIPEIDALHKLPQLTPEQRVREFDRVVASFANVPKDNVGDRHMLALISAYLATVAAGGQASLSLLEPHAQGSPELLAWAYVLGSLGEQVVWTSAFDGLGRLVARELMRPAHFDEMPTCDFSLDEATVVFDGQLPDPLVHLRIKQSRMVSVSLAPGVNIQVALTESQVSGARSTEAAQRDRPTEAGARTQDLDGIVDAVWRKLRGRIEQQVDSLIREERRRSARRSSGQGKLPLKGPEDK